MDITLNFIAMSGLSSTLSLVTDNSLRSPAISVRIGAIFLHGPTPFGPEVDDDGLVGPADGLVEG